MRMCMESQPTDKKKGVIAAVLSWVAASDRSERGQIRSCEGNEAKWSERAEPRAARRVGKASDVGGARPVRTVRQTGPGTMLIRPLWATIGFSNFGNLKF